MEREILLAMDDSENAMRAVDYVASHFPKDYGITLFNVLMDTAMICNMYSPELTPYFTSQQEVFCSLDNKKKEIMDQTLKNAKERLVTAGFDGKLIRIKAQTMKKGVARDIIEEAHQGYETLVMGRRGILGLKEFFLGSVSHKVLNSLKDMSIILVN